VDGAILQIMLEYLYTGKCLFPRDDLNKALEVRMAKTLLHFMNKTAVASHSRNVSPETNEYSV